MESANEKLIRLCEQHYDVIEKFVSTLESLFTEIQSRPNSSFLQVVGFCKKQLVDQLSLFFKGSKNSMQNCIEGLSETVILQCKRNENLTDLIEDIVAIRNRFCFKDYNQTPASTIYETSRVFNTNINVD